MQSPRARGSWTRFGEHNVTTAATTIANDDIVVLRDASDEERFRLWSSFRVRGGGLRVSASFDGFVRALYSFEERYVVS